MVLLQILSQLKSYNKIDLKYISLYIILPFLLFQIYDGPTSEAIVSFQKTPQIQYEEIVSQKNLSPEEDRTQEYHKVFSPVQSEIPQPVVQYENTVPTSSNPGVYIQQNIPEGEKLAINGQTFEEPKELPPVLPSRNEYEETTKHNFRVRGRGRPRARPATTTETITTRRVITKTVPTSSPVQTQNNDEEEEFYGFIRQPNFKQPSNQIQLTSATRQPQYYSNHISQGKNNYLSNRPKDFRLSYDNTNFETTSRTFVGEIKPKYPGGAATSTEASGKDTLKPSRRTRIRANPKKSYESTNSPRNHRPTYSDNPEPVTRRTNLRSRGRSHYKPPKEKQRSKSDEEADVEGGNYPQNFLQNKQTTTSAAPSFQITLDPAEQQSEEDDQAPNASIFRATVVKPEEWHEATGDIEDIEGKYRFLHLKHNFGTDISYHPVQYLKII